jgi:hypothetical protein
MLGQSHFAHRTIRKIVVTFGTLFNDLVIKRYDKTGRIEYEQMRVPLSYGAKEKYITRLTSDPTLTKSIATSLPRMSFDMTGMSYDNSRKQISLMRNYAANTSVHGIDGQFVPVPYNFDFSLSIYARNTEDATQIIEQILPSFTPDLTVTVNFVPRIGLKYDVPIILNSVQPSIDYEGDMMNTRMIMWDLTFTVKAYIFPKVNDALIIRDANTNIYIDTQKRDAQKVYIDVANGFGTFAVVETVRVEDSDTTGKVIYFNTVTQSMVLEDLTELIQPGDVLLGDNSNARYTVTRVDLSPIKVLNYYTTSDPDDAEAYEDYSYDDTITYWPETLLL